MIVGGAIGVVGLALALTQIGGALLAAGWPALLVLLALFVLLEGTIGAILRLSSRRDARAVG